MLKILCLKRSTLGGGVGVKRSVLNMNAIE